MRKDLMALTSCVALLATPAFAAQDGKSAGQTDQTAAKTVDIRTWKLDEAVRAGWSAENLIDTEVLGPNGEDIGEVENLIVGPKGDLQRLVIETGGFLDIGDKHLAVEWKDVTVGPDVEHVTVPITEDTAEEYGMFDDLPERAGKAPREWRATELIGDYVMLEGGVDYGYVDDLIFAKNGQLKAVIVEPDIDYGVDGYYAYPFYGYDYAWDPGLDYYELPYGEAEIADLKPYVASG